jgi:hypothetical protein
MQHFLIRLFALKQSIFEYTVCAAWGFGGFKLAILLEYLPSPEDATKAFIVGSISAGAGIFFRWMWNKIKRNIEI